MKCLIYVSDIAGNAESGGVPSELSNILQRSRINNRKHGITGLLTYRKGRYFQIIEGATDDVDALFGSIQQDSRHSNITQISSLSIKKRSFPDWSMKVSATLDKEASMLQFVYRYRQSLNQLPADKLTLIRFFFNHPALANDSSSPKPYEGLELSIDAWPNFAQIAPTDLLMNLCAELIQGSLTFKQLVANCADYGQGEIFEETRKLEQMGILVKTPCATNSPKPVKARQQNTLYSKLKLFLAW